MRTIFERLYQSVSTYYESINEIEVLLSDLQVYDLTAAQCMMLYNMGRKKMSVNDISRNFCFGKNVSYMLRKAEERGYCESMADNSDKRSIKYFLSHEGLVLFEKLSKYFERPDSRF